MEDNTKLMNKKMDELTVADNVKVTVGLAVATTVIPLATLATVGLVTTAVSKFKERRQDTKNEESEKEE